MTILLALENELHRKIRYHIGHSASVLRIAQEMMDSGLVSENVNVIVRFSGSEVNQPNQGANIATVRSKTVKYEVEVRYKNSQRHGHSFALALLDTISQNVTGYVPDLSGSLGKNIICNVAFQTGFELISESFQELTDASQYIYKQAYQIKLLLPQGEISPLPCPVEFNRIELIDCLPCKRCLKTQNKVLVGIAEWKNPQNEEIIYIFDPAECPTRPGDRMDVDIVEDLGNNLYSVDFVFTPLEAISYTSEGTEQIDVSQQINSSFSPYYYSSEGEIPDYCKDFKVIFDVYAEFPDKIDEEGNLLLRRFASKK